MIVGRDGGKAALPCGVDGACEPEQRLPLVAKLHQWQVNSKLQTAPMLAYISVSVQLAKE
jgi:hypothetical protein